MCNWRHDWSWKCSGLVSGEHALKMGFENVGHFNFVGREHLVVVEHVADRVAADNLPFDVGVDSLWIPLGV